MNQEDVWNSISKKWSEFRTTPTPEVLEFLKGKKGKILDLGCGSGRHCIETDGLDFYGVDFSKELLKFTKEKKYIETKKGFTYDIPYEDEFFDYVIFSRVLHCVDSEEKRKKSLEEIYRVLKKNGQALISAWGRGQKRLKNKPKESFIPWGVDGEKIQRYTYIYDFEELEKDLKDIGFKIIKSWEDNCSNFIVQK